jgi:hypothetical protein
MNIHKAKEQYKQELAAVPVALFNCSAIEYPVQWGVFV